MGDGPWTECTGEGSKSCRPFTFSECTAETSAFQTKVQPVKRPGRLFMERPEYLASSLRPDVPCGLLIEEERECALRGGFSPRQRDCSESAQRIRGK